MLALASSPSSSPVIRLGIRTRLGIRASSGLTVRRRPPPSDEVGVDGGRLAFPEIGAAKRVVLVRHGQSTWNEEGRIQGSSDHSVLTTKGEAQAETSRQMLLSDTFDVCFTSPLIRSKRTAEIIWDARMEEMIPESDLREIDLYSFQTPNSPIAAGASAGRKARNRIILVCHGTTQSNDEVSFSSAVDKPMNMLGIIQSQKTAELLLDLKVNPIICTPSIASIDTSMTISKVQEAADCLGADCIPRYVEVKKMEAFAFDTVQEIWDEGGRAWDTLLQELADESEPGKNVVVVGHPAIHIALIVRCLNLTKEWLGSFHLDAGSISVIDFPDGPDGRGVIRCVNYTAHLGRWSIPITRSTLDDEEF
ncbi:hypothetical protein QJS10_CPB13g01678 [Acorus calamus]|uniref:Uncharacterized protein n=1 Tax=Acorus calamus TaxID=4465 RepID=A0AAV9DI29_ACOCL|nr:hypothetical protein QJS10_CPB13g01678 [Acorus calamus]